MAANSCTRPMTSSVSSRRVIADRAERTFAELPASEQETARWTLLQLVVLGEGALDFAAPRSA